MNFTFVYKLKISNKFQDIGIKNYTYYFFNDTINIKNFGPNKIKTDEKSYKNLIYYIGYVTIRDSKYLKITSVNPLYLIIKKVNGYFEEISKNKYLTLVPTNEIKEIMKNHEELQSKIRNLISSITKNYAENYMKMEPNLDDDENTIEIRSRIIVGCYSCFS